MRSEEWWWRRINSYSAAIFYIKRVMKRVMFHVKHDNMGYYSSDFYF